MPFLRDVVQYFVSFGPRLSEKPAPFVVTTDAGEVVSRHRSEASALKQARHMAGRQDRSFVVSSSVGRGTTVSPPKPSKAGT